jgi:hypothetical protein
VGRAAVLTDSRDDDDILDVCAQPLLVKWPQARFIPAQRGTYLPLEYTHRVKRPGLSYVQRSILGDDYALWLLASIAVSVAPIPHAIGLLLLVLSFWTIYELGYVDNDQIGVKFEASPTLTEEFHRVAVATSVPQAWLWALGLGALGVALVEDSFAPSLSSLAGWMAVLFATFGIYLLYNRVDKSTRIWLYAFLQLARAAAFLVIVPITVFGAMALAAHAVSRWFLYFLYRTTGRDWPLDVSANIVRLMIFGMLVVPLAVAVDIDKASVVTIAIVLGWFSFRPQASRTIQAGASHHESG